VAKSCCLEHLASIGSRSSNSYNHRRYSTDQQKHQARLSNGSADAIQRPQHTVHESNGLARTSQQYPTPGPPAAHYTPNGSRHARTTPESPSYAHHYSRSYSTGSSSSHISDGRQDQSGRHGNTYSTTSNSTPRAEDRSPYPSSRSRATHRHSDYNGYYASERSSADGYPSPSTTHTSPDMRDRRSDPSPSGYPYEDDYHLANHSYENGLTSGPIYGSPATRLPAQAHGWPPVQPNHSRWPSDAPLYRDPEGTVRLFPRGSVAQPTPHYPPPPTFVRRGSHTIPCTASCDPNSNNWICHEIPQPQNRPRRRGNLPKSATELCKSWLYANRHSPYPSEEQKIKFCQETGLTMSQVRRGFTAEWRSASNANLNGR
jgi:hypothetical protein